VRKNASLKEKEMKKVVLTIAIAMVVIALVMMTGCNDGSKVNAPQLAVIPDYGGAIPHFHAQEFTQVSSFAGPIGRYGFTVIVGEGSPPDTTGRKYRLNVTEVTKANVFVRYILPGADGKYDLSPAGFYHAEAFVTPSAPPAPLVAESWVQTGDFPPPSQ
jgi:hypothetical protein